MVLPSESSPSHMDISVLYNIVHIELVLFYKRKLRLCKRMHNKDLCFVDSELNELLICDYKIVALRLIDDVHSDVSKSLYYVHFILT